MDGWMGGRLDMWLDVLALVERCHRKAVEVEKNLRFQIGKVNGSGGPP